MAKKDKYDDIDVLWNDIENDIENTLTDEVLETVREIELKHIKNEVFSYRPKIYKRRKNGGIDDPDNTIGKIVGRMDMEVMNITPFNPDYGTHNSGNELTELINDGDGKNGWYYDYSGEFLQPRPFLDYTKEEILKTQQIDNAMQKGMRKRGYDVK